VQSTKVGSGVTGQGKADTSASLPVAPLYALPLHNTATATQNGTGQVIDFEGSVVLTPGAYAIFATPGQASVAGMWFSFMWEEIPLIMSQS
jgi:hypothetical protein